MSRHMGALRWLVRKLFRDSVISVRGEANSVLWLRPAEYPSLLLGPKRVEADICREWCALLRSDEVIYDVGANIGFTVQRFIAILNGRCRIWAFEPLERNLDLLERNVRDLSADVTIVRCALGDKTGSVLLSNNLRHGGLSRLHALGSLDREGAKFWRDVVQVEVPMVTLDEYAASAGIAPTFVKLDVEGAGHWVLAGARRTLENRRPMISCSLHSAEERRGVIELLAEYGYGGVAVARDGRSTWCNLAESTGNYVHPLDARSKSFGT